MNEKKNNCDPKVHLNKESVGVVILTRSRGTS